MNPSLIQGLIYPGGLAVDGQGVLFVSSYDRVGEYTTSGGAVNPSLISGGYNSAVGIALDGNGHLYWANNYGGEGGNRIGLYTTAGEVLNATFITGLHNPVAMVVVPEPTAFVLFGMAGVVIYVLVFRGRRQGAGR